MAEKIQQYSDNGVFISKSQIYPGDEITVTYSGLLVNSGADMVYIHLGYGENWDNKDLIQMKHDGEAFKATFEVVQVGTLNIAFKDRAENWDNNSANNYSFKVTKKAVKSVKASGEKKAAAKETPAKSSTKTKAAAAKKTAAKDETAAVTVKKTVRKTTKKAEPEK